MQRIGCLGAARISPKALCEPSYPLANAELHAIAARDHDRAKQFAKVHGFAHAYERYQDVLDDPDVSLVYNPLPVNLHAEWSIRALEAGKHVLCEKPFAMNMSEVEAMQSAAKANGKRLIEAFHYRYHPAFEDFLNLIDEGEIGEIQHVLAAFTVPIANKGGTEIRHLKETGGGAFMDLGCYPLHWVRSAMRAEPTAIDAMAELTPTGVDETLTARLEFGTGATAELHASMASTMRFNACLEVIGTHGRIEFENPLAPQMGARLELTREGMRHAIEIEPVPTYSYQLEAVIGALETGEDLPTEGADTLAQQTALDAIYEAAGLGHLRRV